MTIIKRAEALEEFGSGRVEAAEMLILMRDDRYDTKEHMAQIGDKWWRFVPRQDQLDTMTRNR